MVNKATKSLTTGMKVLGGGSVPTFTLEYLTPCGTKKRGDYETIVVPYIEMGRDPSCAVRFSEDSETVSRKHAAIERTGQDTFIINLSKTNPTLVNGRPVRDRYYLNSGDEIQLSVEGPRLRYNTSREGLSKMGFTSKLNLVMQQSIRPYRTAVIALALVLLTSIAAAGFLIFEMQKTLTLQEELIVAQTELTRAQADSIAAMNAQNADLVRRFQATQQAIEQERQQRNRELQQLEGRIVELREESERLMRSAVVNYADIIEPLKPMIIGISLNYIEMEFAGERQRIDAGGHLMCTGFLIEGGTFVTARHCIDLYETEGSPIMVLANIFEHNGGQVSFHFTGASYDGNVRFDFSNRDLTADYSSDTLVEVEIEGEQVVMREQKFFQGSDWAYMQTRYAHGLKFDKPLSSSLRNGTDLFVLGYSYGMDFRTSGNLEPYFSTARVTLSGIEGGVVQATETGTDKGNSGGPVFTLVDGQPYVIGIVYGGYRNIFLITPMFNLM
jgi:hypothetical protein